MAGVVAGGNSTLRNPSGNRGHPLAAGPGQIADAKRRSKAGRSLRLIAWETNLSLSTVRSIVDKADGTDRATLERLQRIDPDRAGRMSGPYSIELPASNAMPPQRLHCGGTEMGSGLSQQARTSSTSRPDVYAVVVVADDLGSIKALDNVPFVHHVASPSSMMSRWWAYASCSGNRT